MDKCPKCLEYSLDFDLFKNVAVCYNNDCSYNEKMSEDKYILKLADKAKYVVLPTYLLEKIKEQQKESVKEK